MRVLLTKPLKPTKVPKGLTVEYLDEDTGAAETAAALRGCDVFVQPWIRSPQMLFDAGMAYATNKRLKRCDQSTVDALLARLAPRVALVGEDVSPWVFDELQRAGYVATRVERVHGPNGRTNLHASVQGASLLVTRQHGEASGVLAHWDTYRNALAQVFGVPLLVEGVALPNAAESITHRSYFSTLHDLAAALKEVPGAV